MHFAYISEDNTTVPCNRRVRVNLKAPKSNGLSWFKCYYYTFRQKGLHIYHIDPLEKFVKIWICCPESCPQFEFGDSFW